MLLRQLKFNKRSKRKVMGNKENGDVHRQKIFCIISVARQTDGEFVIVKAEKAFKQASKADAYASGLAKRYTESIPTPSGQITCICERGVFEIELDDEE